jgi:phosphoribosylpyrophosphate synthetase
MTGFTLIIDHQNDKLNLYSQMEAAAEGATKIEEAVLGCVQTAVQACVQELLRAYDAKQIVTYDDHSQKAAEVFRRCFDQWLQQNAANN